MENSHAQYCFFKFRFDTRSSSLYFEDELVEKINKKSAQILLTLLESPKQVVSHDEIIQRVWADNYRGITASNVAHYIRKIRKALAEIQPETTFIGTAPNRGYLFEQDVTVVNEPLQAAFASNEALFPQNQVFQSVVETKPPEEAAFRRYTRPKFLLPLLAVIVSAIGASSYFSAPEEDQVRQTVRDSQLYESLVLYREPVAFKEENLDKFWTPELDVNYNYDRSRIRKAVEKLISENRRYGDETKPEQFEFQSVEIDTDNEIAVVKTLEKWFIAEYGTDGVLIKNKFVGPYFVSYVLRKINGRWLIEKSNTARSILPPPRLSKIELISEPTGGTEFFINLSGEELLSAVVLIKVVGAGCPESNPCTISNAPLRSRAKLSDKRIENIPLTLSSGEYRLFAQNGESQPSNSVSFSVR